MSDSPDEFGFDDGVRPERLLFLLALAVVTAGFGVALYLSSDRGDESDQVVDAPAGLTDDDDGDGDGDGGEDRAPVAAIGPEPGADLTRYAQDRGGVLAAATGERVAVVSFTGYLTEDAATEVLADVEVGVLFVAFPGGEATATSDVEALRAEMVAEAEAQLPELRSLLPTVDDPEFADFYAAEIVRYEAILAAGAVPDVVSGAVVRADAEALRALAAQETVRLVDVGGSAALTHDAVLRSLRPEETGTAGTPVTRPT